MDSELIGDIYNWEKSALWPPNKKMFRRALVTLGESDKWGVGTMSLWDAKEVRESKRKGGRDNIRWKRICLAIEERKNNNMFAKERADFDVSKDKVEATPKSVEDYQSLSMKLHNKDLEINTLKTEIKNFKEAKGDQQSVESMRNKYMGAKELANQYGALYRQEQERVEKLLTSIEKLNGEISRLSDSATGDSEETLNELHTLRQKISELEANSDKIDYQTAVSGLMQGRVLPPEVSTTQTLTDEDRADLKEYIRVWTDAFHRLPDTHVYGMKHAESNILNRRGATIDDYGQPKCKDEDVDLMRVLAYLDGVVSHVHQEIHSGFLMAEELVK